MLMTRTKAGVVMCLISMGGMGCAGARPRYTASPAQTGQLPPASESPDRVDYDVETEACWMDGVSVHDCIAKYGCSDSDSPYACSEKIARFNRRRGR